MFYQSTLVEENTLILCHSFGFSLNKGPNLELWPSLVRGGGGEGYLQAELQSKKFMTHILSVPMCVCVYP